jgi:hypothetical protein
MPFPFAKPQRGVEADVALDLIGIVVQRGGAIVDSPKARNLTGIEQDRLRQRGFASSAIGQEADIPHMDPFEILAFHTHLPGSVPGARW